MRPRVQLVQLRQAEERMKEMLMDIQHIAVELHNAALRKGFWKVEDAERKHIAKMFLELGEVIQADRAGIMHEYERDGKPEGVAAELADFAMMLLDYVEYKGFTGCLDGWEYDAEIYNDGMQAYELVLWILKDLDLFVEIFMERGIEWLRAREATEGEADTLARSVVWHIIERIRLWLLSRRYSLMDLMKEKMEYNDAHRGKLHGKMY